MIKCKPLDTFSKRTFKKYCNSLRKQDPIIASIHSRHGYPPFWKRDNGFESLCKTIIEQQVSLASANASYMKLKAYCKEIEPGKLAAMNEASYRLNGITRQKGKYLQLLAIKVLEEPDFFESLERMDDQTALKKLISLKGIGHWTASVYLLVALNRLSVYPPFDVALINSIAYEVFEEKKITNEEARVLVDTMEPFQSIACCYFYHAYIQRRNLTFVP